MKYSISTINHITTALNFAKRCGYNINLDNPTTIQDKLMWLNIFDVNPLKSLCADKIKLHDYSKLILGEDICIPIIKIYNNTKEINFDELPNQFVLKCNHGSGMNIIVNNKSQLNYYDTINKLNHWLSVDFTFQNGFEAHYHDIVKKCFAEEYMNFTNHESLYDYKFWCFNGEPQIYTINDGNGHGDIMYYTIDGKELNLYNVPKHNDYIKPKLFNKMVEYSKQLSKLFKFVRVDFYEINNKVYLGELTFTPGACLFSYTNPEDNIKIGNLLKID